MDNIIAAGLSLGQATESLLRTAPARPAQGCTPALGCVGGAERPRSLI